MSKYNHKPIDFGPLKTVSLFERGGKVKTSDFAAAPCPGAGMRQWLDSLPRLLAADSLRAVVRSLETARRNGRAILWGMGGHVVKCGLAPVFRDLMDRGFVSGIAMNGSAAIHDFEIALAGHTSEDVEAVLPGGRFGSAEETGREFNRAACVAMERGIGIGESLGECLEQLARPDFADHSILLQAWRRSIPVTVHVAIGTDTPHTHPAADGAAIGAATHYDFRLFARLVTGLHDGGVYLNVGSAVVMPEVFLKAVSAVRNLGYPLRDFTTVNFDFLQHYRPRVNVVERPHADAGGRGYAITGHHEIMIPLVAAVLAESGA